MTGSDFTKSAARVSEGFCPLCDDQLERESGTCGACDVRWWFDSSTGKPALRTSRGLTKDEIKKLYDREGA